MSNTIRSLYDNGTKCYTMLLTFFMILPTSLFFLFACLANSREAMACRHSCVIYLTGVHISLKNTIYRREGYSTMKICGWKWKKERKFSFIKIYVTFTSFLCVCVCVFVLWINEDISKYSIKNSSKIRHEITIKTNVE